MRARPDSASSSANTSRKTVRCTAILRSYDIGVHGYGVQGGVKNVTLDRIIVAESGIGYGPVNRAANLVAETEGSIDNLVVKRSVFWQPEGVVGGGVRFGSGNTNGKLYFTDNTVACGAQGLSVNNFDAVVTGNTIAGTRSGNPNANAVVADWQNPRGTWDANTYHSPLPGPFTFNRQKGADGGGLLNWVDWRRLSGADTSSTFSADPLPPLSQVIKFVTRKGGFVIGEPFDPSVFGLAAYKTTDLSSGGLVLRMVRGLG